MFDGRPLGGQMSLFAAPIATALRQRGPDLPDLDLLYWPQFLSPTEAADLFAELRSTTDWQGGTYRFKDKVQVMPRLIASFRTPEEFTPPLESVRRRVQAACELAFDRVLLSLYRDERDSVTWHRDHEVDRKPAIAALSLGECRRFRLRHSSRRDLPLVTFHLAPGSLLLMKGATNDNWEHQVPKEREARGERISLTFRRNG